MFSKVPTELLDVIAHVPDDGRVLQQPVTLRLTASAVDSFVADVGFMPVGFLAFWRHAAGCHPVEVLPASPHIGAGDKFSAGRNGTFGDFGRVGVAICRHLDGRL